MNLLNKIIKYFKDKYIQKCPKCNGDVVYSYYEAKLDCNIYKCKKCNIEYK